jgi:hypothetical protein
VVAKEWKRTLEDCKMTVELNKPEIDAILSSLQLLSKQNQVIVEDCLSISINQLYNKLTSIQEQLYYSR